MGRARRMPKPGWLRRLGGHRAQRVLVVDDDEAIRSLLVVTLTAAGFRVVDATTGAEALELLAQAPVAVAVIDAAMPGMDGLEVAARIRPAGETSGPRVLLLGRLPTGVDDDTIDAQLPKPFEPRELVEWVELLAT